MDLLLPEPGDSLTAILKLAGDGCNINCYYCYEKRRPGDDKSWLSAQTLAHFLAAARSRPLRVVFQGGEPLLIGVARMRELLEVMLAYDGPLEVTMQTNGMLLSDAWLDLFDEMCPDIDIGVSLDGPRAANAYRVDYRDRPTFDKVLAGIELLHRRGREIGLCVTVTHLLLGLEHELMTQLGEFPHVRSVRLSPCLDYNVTTRKFPKGNAASLIVLNGSGQGAPGWATTPTEYAKFVACCFDIWRTGHFRNFLMEPLFSILLALTGGESALTDWSPVKEPFIVVLYPDGRIGTSDEISGTDSTLGSVDTIGDLDEIVSYQRNPALLLDLRAQLAACDGCRHVAVCAGGSLADRLRLRGTPWEEEYCDSRRWLIDYIREAT
jgi:radical SAM protein with 4Fe4S-binding SPASM domain